MKEFVFDGKPESVRNVLELHAKGVPVVCPVCNAQLIIAPDLESANRQKVHAGIYCPVSEHHVQVMFHLGRDSAYWDKFKKGQ